jgi:hypothetical protein
LRERDGIFLNVNAAWCGYGFIFNPGIYLIFIVFSLGIWDEDEVFSRYFELFQLFMTLTKFIFIYNVNLTL